MKTSNLRLRPLPDDYEVLAAVAAICERQQRQMVEARAEGHPYYREVGATANMVAHHLRVEGANRAGRGAVQGSWSGTMSPALRIAPRLRALARASKLDGYYTSDCRWAYAVPEPPRR